MLKQPMGVVLALPIVLGGLGVGTAQAALLPSACDAVSGNLVVNCGGETTTGWSAVDRYPTFNSGTQALRIGYNTWAHAMEQSVATIAGQTYSLAFFAYNTNNFTFAVYFGGQKVGDFAPTASFFAGYTASVTASSTSSILRFEKTGSSSYGMIDDVVLLAVPPTGVPEPASLAVLGAGLAGLAGLGRRRRRKA